MRRGMSIRVAVSCARPSPCPCPRRWGEVEQGAQVRRNTMVRSPGEGREDSKLMVSSAGALLAFFLGPHAPGHYCAHPRCMLPPTSVPGRRAGFGAAGCQARPGVGAAGRPQRLCPSARRGGRSWWPVVGGGLGNKAHQELHPPPAQPRVLQGGR